MKAKATNSAPMETSPQTTKDARWVRRAKSGDPNAFGRLVLKYQNRVLALAYDLTGNYEDARDVAQNAFIKAFEKLTLFRESATFSTWLYRVTYNTAIDYYRQKKKKSHQSLDQMISTRDAGLNTTAFTVKENHRLEKKELSSALENALEGLSLQQKTATKLKYIHEMTTSEIAEIMECTESTVRNHIFRALRRLKQTMRGWDGESGG